MTLNENNRLLFIVQNIRKRFRNGFRITYSGAMEIKRQYFTFITGGSGIGKSTLLHILGLLDYAEKINSPSMLTNSSNPNGNHSILTYFPEQNAEEINYFDLFRRQWHPFKQSHKRAQIRRTDFGFLPQDGHLLNTFSIQENLKLVLGLCQHPGHQEQKIQTILNDVGFRPDEKIGGKLNVSPLNLSGGQRQRLALARALINFDYNSPKVIFVDEPTTYMDEDLVRLTINLLIDLVLEHQNSIILVTHEYEKLHGFLQQNLQDRDETLTIDDTYSLQLDSVTDRTSNVRLIHHDP